jgi:hypothetical protein
MRRHTSPFLKESDGSPGTWQPVHYDPKRGKEAFPDREASSIKREDLAR